MKIDKITFEMGRDFNAVMVCEHCGHKQENKSGYHDTYYHTQVIPGMHCNACGRNRDGELTPAPKHREEDEVWHENR